jgi:hypothetical protein
MNKIYLIIPIALTLAFSGVYYTHTIEAKKTEAVAMAKAKQIAEQAAAKKLEAERQARADADRRTNERLAEEKKKEDDKRAKWEAIGQSIQIDTDGYKKQITQSESELKLLESRLKTLRAEKERAIQIGFAFELEIEKARIEKRNAELNIQNLVEMVARKAGTTLGSVAATP